MTDLKRVYIRIVEKARKQAQTLVFLTESLLCYKNVDKIRKIMFSSNMKKKWCYNEIFHTQLCFDMFYAVKSSEVKTEFPNVWGETKYHSNPYIHSATILCDNNYSKLVTCIIIHVLQ